MNRNEEGIRGMPRSAFVGRAVVIGAAALGGAAVSGGTPTASGADDARAIGLLLLVEYTEAALYDQALEAGKLGGALRDYARTAAGHEREHLAFLKRQVGAGAPPVPGFDFGDAVRESGAFVDRATAVEDLAVAAYNGQGANVTRETLAAAASVVSVEARHAAWIRSIAGRPPAPNAVDSPKSADEVLAGLERAGMRR